MLFARDDESDTPTGRGKNSAPSSAFPKRGLWVAIAVIVVLYNNLLDFGSLLKARLAYETESGRPNFNVSSVSSTSSVTTPQKVSLVTSFFADGIRTLTNINAVPNTTANERALHLHEITAAILKNIHNPYFAQVVVVLDGASHQVHCRHFREYMETMEKELREWSHQNANSTILPDHGHLQKLSCVNREQGQPNYYEMFQYATNSNVTSPIVTSPIVVLENADQVFDETLRWAGFIKRNTVLTLPSHGYNHHLTPPQVQAYFQFAHRNNSLSKKKPLEWEESTRCKKKVTQSWDGYIFHLDYVRGTLDPHAFQRPTDQNTTGFFHMNEYSAENAALQSLLQNLPNDTHSAHGCWSIHTWHYHAAPKMHVRHGFRWANHPPHNVPRPYVKPQFWAADNAFVVDPPKTQ